MVGHVECLRQTGVEDNWKASRLDLSPMLQKVENDLGKSFPGAEVPHFVPSMAPDVGLDRTLDATLLIPYTKECRATMGRMHFSVDIANVDRCTGTMLGSVITKEHPKGLPDGSIEIECTGSAGQSFGAFLPAGVTLNVHGDANDYFGKGLSGGILTVAPADTATYKFDENVAVGNVAFYGATAGKGFINGLAGQRFGVRNSGATIVCEGVGNHGCEYMTGGRALILGPVGVNFAAGMSGGIAFVYDERHVLAGRVNRDMVLLEKPTEDDLEYVRALIREHADRTKSPRGIKMLYQFDDIKDDFVKVIPREYKRVLDLTAEAKAAGMSDEAAAEHAFEVMREGM